MGKHHIIEARFREFERWRQAERDKRIRSELGLNAMYGEAQTAPLLPLPEDKPEPPNYEPELPLPPHVAWDGHVSGTPNLDYDLRHERY